MNRKHALSCLAVTIALIGCAEPAEPPVCSQAEALRTEQGTGLNGIQFNGEVLQGVRINGIVPNGIVPNGIVPNGIVPNGIVPNTLTNNGIVPNGIVPNNSSSKGIDLRVSGGGFVNLQGSELHAVVDGATIEGQAWVGAVVTGVTADAKAIRLTIGAVTRDPVDPELTYYVLHGPDGQNICGGGGSGLFLRGVWDESGARRDDQSLLSYSCTTGVLAKCVSWGYKPWRVGSDMHQACTRMARADYCGDGVAHTLEGTSIDVFDREGIQRPAASPADGFVFEAGWGPDGATCVAHPRYREVESDGRVRAPACWDRLPVCNSFAEAQIGGALLGNASVERARPVCGL